MLPVTTLSQATSKQHQWSQEVRWAGDFSSRVSSVFGFYAFTQQISGDPVQLEQAGSAAYRFALAPSANASTPGLLDGLTSATYTTLDTKSAAIFGQIDWSITDRLHFQPGIRFNYDKKVEDYERDVYGGLQTTNTALIALQRSVYAPQAFKADVSDNNTSGQLTLAYRANRKLNAYVTYATNYKSVGINNGGLPTDAAGNTILTAAEVKPEYVTNVEAGVKLTFRPGATANIAIFNTDIEDLQVQVNNSQFGVPRGYLANAKKARSRGAEFDGNATLGSHVTVRGALAYTDAHLRVVPRRTGAARRNGRAGGRRRFRRTAAGNLEVGRVVRHGVLGPSQVPRYARASCSAASISRTATSFLRARRHRST